MKLEKFKDNVQQLKQSKDYDGLNKLLWKTGESEKDIKEYIANALEEIGDEKAMEILANIISDRPTDCGEIASKSLSRMKTPKLVVKYAIMAYEKGIKKISKSSVNGVNLEASFKLVIKSLGEKAVEPLLDSVLKDTNLMAYNLIEELLLIYTTVNSVELLKERLFSPDRRSRELISVLLTNLKWEPSTIEEKVTKFISYREWGELEKLGESALEYLFESTNIKDNYLVKSKPKIIGIIGKIGSLKAVEPLIEILNNNSYPKPTIKALGEIGDPQAVAPILNHIKSTNHLSILLNSSIYVNALTKIGKSAQNDINIALKDSNKHVRKIAKDTLKRLSSRTP
ncbi:MAG: hypothetical protein KAT14_04160 [Candidatus Marinimicrobia bacterium]|nr:hypothetical protein [Candidatus Neomarinimicrobiota bacterium]